MAANEQPPLSDLEAQPLVAILQLCAAAAPEPWYPSLYARQNGIERARLDAPLDRLRLGGLIELTEWVQGTGQGYRLTAEGTRLLQSRRELALLQQGKLPRQREQAVEEDSIRPARLPGLTPYERGEIVRAALLEPIRPVVTTALILANVGVFLWGLSLARGEQLLAEYLDGFGPQVWPIQRHIGALSGLDIVEHEWWRLVSACFVHFGFIHLFVNMYTLYALGPWLEQFFGRWRFLTLYLLSGVGGSCAMLLVRPEMHGAGASGALWGLMIAYGAWMFLNRHYRPGPLNPAAVRNYIAVLLLNVFVSMLPYISAAGHFGGGAIGLVAAVLLNGERFATDRQRLFYLLGVVLVPIGCVGSVVWDMRDGAHWSQLEYENFRRGISRDRSLLDSPLGDYQKLYQERLREVLERLPERREPAAVARAQQASAELPGRYVKLADHLGQLGPYRSPAVEAARQAALELARSAANFYRQVMTCLEPGENWKQQEHELERRQKELEGKVAIWQARWDDYRTAWDRLRGGE